MKFDIYDEQKLARQLEIQQKKAWDFEKGIDWNMGIDMSKPLLPLDANSIIFPTANSQQKIVISQLMGLIVAASISQLEEVACKLKGPTWEKFLNKYPVNPEMYELGEQFFAEEEKHARAFNRYIDMFAHEVNVDPKDLKKFLPQASESIIGQVYKANAYAGGMAMWWLISAVEEESIIFYKYIRGVKDQVDPLYHNLHRCHFEEEVRHKSYAQMMLQAYNDFSRSPQALFFKKMDFIMAEVLHMTWTFNQIIKVRELNKFKNHHPFFQNLSGAMELLNGRKPLEIIHKLFTTAPYISHTLHLSEHKQVNQMLNRFSSLKIPMPKRKEMDVSCTA